MKSTKLLAAACLISLAAIAADTGQFVDVVATGHGSTVREATKAALRAAVEQVVGTMVDASTLVENDELIEDEILSYSAGMIEKATPIGEPKKSEEGFYTVKVKATVKKGKLEEKLRAASAVNVTLDGADLFARMTAAQDNLADAEKMIENVLAKHVACIVAKEVPGENGTSPIDFDPKTGEVFANVRVRIDMAKYRQFVKEVLEKLGSMAERKIPFSGDDRDYYWRFRPSGISSLGNQNILLVIDNMRTLQANALFFDNNKFAAIHKSFLAGEFPEIGARFAVQINLLDSLADRLSTKIEWLPNGNCAILGQLSWYKNSATATCMIAPFCGGHFDSDGDFRKEDCWTDRTFRISLGKFTPEELKTAGKLEIKVGHMKDGQFVE